MKLTRKRHTVSKRLHKEDNPIGTTKIAQNKMATKLFQDLSSLLPLAKEEGYIGGSIEDVVLLGGEITIDTPVSKVISEYHLFGNDVVLKDQIFIGLVYEYLSNSIELMNFCKSLDWADVVVTREKQDFIRELEDRIKKDLNLDIDFMDYYTTSLKDYLEAREELKKVENLNTPFNLNLAMFLELVGKGFIAVKETDSGYLSGESLLMKPYDSNEMSYTNTCKKQYDDKAFCIVEYYRTMVRSKIDSLKEEGRKLEIVDTTKESLDRIPDNFYLKFGYKSIYALIVSRL